MIRICTKIGITLILISIFNIKALTQGIALNSNGTKADNSAMLDISAINKGLLVPRVALQNVNDKVTIPSPAHSLLVYNIGENMPYGLGFYYNRGTADEPLWMQLGTTPVSAAWLIGGNDDVNDDVSYMGTNIDEDVVFRRNGVLSMQIRTGGALLVTGDETGVTPTYGKGTRLMWIPAKAAFRAGAITESGIYNWDEDSIGKYSFASGRDTKALGDHSFASGGNTKATGNYSFTAGSFTQASGATSIAMGNQAIATQNLAVSIGYQTKATGKNAFAFGGLNTTASGDTAVAMGYKTLAEGKISTAMGSQTIAQGDYSTAMGYQTMALGWYSTAMGRETKADNFNATAMGLRTIALGNTSTAIGLEAEAWGNASISIGDSTIADGDNSLAIGYKSLAKEKYSIAIGYQTLASGTKSLAVGDQTIAQGIGSFASGEKSDAIGNYSATFGKATAIGNYSIAGGTSTATAEYAAAFGYGSTANGLHSFAAGSGANAFGDRSVALNNGTTEKEANYAFATGTSNAKNTSSVAMGSGNEAIGKYTVALGQDSYAAGVASLSMGNESGTTGDYSAVIGKGLYTSAYANFVVGSFNKFGYEDLAKEFKPNQPIFQIGNGPDVASRSNAITVLANAKTGINTTDNPEALLHLKGTANGGWNRHIRLEDESSSNYGAILYDEEGMKFRNFKEGNTFYFRNKDNGTIAKIESNGNMEISGELTQNSDIRLKNNIEILSNVLNKISKIQPVKYDFIDKVNHPSVRQIGFSAQEIQKAFPELVSQNKEGYLSVAYTNMTAVAIQAIKEQQEIISSQEKRIEQLENQIKVIINKLNK